MTNMKFISHRGNIYEADRGRENTPEYIGEALEAGFDVEIDVWYLKGEYFLGHDWAYHPVDVAFLKNPKLLCHAKNSEGLEHMLLEGGIHCFWHQEDRYTLSSLGIPIVYPGEIPLKNSIVMTRGIDLIPELITANVCSAICSDHVQLIIDIREIML